MSSKKNYHITKTDKGWQGKAEGAQRASTTASTKSEAIKQMAQIARNNGNSSVKIHKSDGTFQEERTYPRSKDPRQTKG